MANGSDEPINDAINAWLTDAAYARIVDDGYAGSPVDDSHDATNGGRLLDWSKLANVYHHHDNYYYNDRPEFWNANSVHAGCCQSASVTGLPAVLITRFWSLSRRIRRQRYEIWGRNVHLE